MRFWKRAEPTSNVKGKQVEPPSQVRSTANDVNAKDERGWTALMLAEDAQRVEALIAAGADVNAKTNDGHTALHHAAIMNNVNKVKALVAAGADLNAKDDSGWTALMLAEDFGCVEALIAAGADVNAKSNKLGTALHSAAHKDDAKKVKALVAAGADLNVKDDSGFTALAWAGSLHPNAAAVLRAAEAQSQAQNLLRWERSGFPRQWVDDHHGQWGHSDWLDLLEKLKGTDYWPMEPDAIGRVLEGHKKAQPSAAKPGSLELPPEFDGKLSYRDMFRTRTPERLRAMCRALPIEALNVNRPGISKEMGWAITQVFAVATYMATEEVPSEYGDIVFPRLVSQITKYNASDIHEELWVLIRDFATHLLGVKRYREAYRVLVSVRGTPFGRVWPEADICIFVALQHIAVESNLRSDFLAALEAAKRIPARQTMTDINGDTVQVDQMVRESIKNLKQKMEASTRS